jgi:hypothetical protein
LIVTVRRPGVRGGDEIVVGRRQVESHGPRAMVVGTGDRVDLAVGGDAVPLPGGLSSQGGDGIMPRHLALIVVPLPTGTLLRAISLHPERGFAVLPVENELPSVDAIEAVETGLGSVVAWNALRITFDGYVLDVVVNGGGAPDVLDVLPVGHQLTFASSAASRAVGSAVASVAGPEGGGHAIPALVVTELARTKAGSLLLRTREGVVQLELEDEDLVRGVLIGRSRRCVLGRGFDENDGLSRVHALVVGLAETGTSGVFAFDLASRYGLRDVSRPSRMVPMSRLDDGVGCLVYGAGYLTWEFR